MSFPIVRNGFLIPFLAALGLVLGMGATNGEILIDNFNDGNDDGWTHIDLLPLDNGGPAIFDASSGAYNLRSTGPNDNSAGGTGILSTWDDSADPFYANGFLRMKVRSDVARGIVGALMSTTGDFNVGTGATYFFVGRANSNDFRIQRWVQGVSFQSFEVPGVTFNLLEDWIIESGVVGDQLSMKVWPDGDPVPASPQLIMPDPDPLPLGQFGVIAYNASLIGSAMIDATFDDIHFRPIPQPSTLALAGLGLLGIGFLRRKHR